MKIEAKIKNGYASLFINDVEIPFCSEIIKVEVPHSYENDVITFECNGVEIFEDEYNTLHIKPMMQETAKWINQTDDDLAINDYQCSKCDYWTEYNTKYCPNCGRRMKGAEE